MELGNFIRIGCRAIYHRLRTKGLNTSHTNSRFRTCFPSNSDEHASLLDLSLAPLRIHAVLYNSILLETLATRYCMQILGKNPLLTGYFCYQCTDWDSSRRPLELDFIETFVPERKYKTKPQSSFWFTSDCLAAISPLRSFLPAIPKL